MRGRTSSGFLPTLFSCLHHMCSQFVQALIIPVAFTLCSFVGIAVTSAGSVLYGEVLWDPLRLIGRWDNRAAAFFASFAYSAFASSNSAVYVSTQRFTRWATIFVIAYVHGRVHSFVVDLERLRHGLYLVTAGEEEAGRGIGMVASMIPPPRHDGARIVRLTPGLRLCKRKQLTVNTAL